MLLGTALDLRYISRWKTFKSESYWDGRIKPLNQGLGVLEESGLLLKEGYKKYYKNILPNPVTFIIPTKQEYYSRYTPKFTLTKNSIFNLFIGLIVIRISLFTVEVIISCLSFLGVESTLLSTLLYVLLCGIGFWLTLGKSFIVSPKEYEFIKVNSYSTIYLSNDRLLVESSQVMRGDKNHMGVLNAVPLTNHREIVEYWLKDIEYIKCTNKRLWGSVYSG